MATGGTPMTFADAVAGQFPANFRKKYADDLILSLQEKKTKLRDTVTLIPDAKGEKLIFQFLEGWELDEVTTRNSATVYSDEETAQREVAWKKWDKAYPVDDTDEIALMLDPTWAVKENHMRAARRAVDKAIYNALFATVTTGHESDGSAAWSSANSDCTIIAHGSKGLTKEKILEGKSAIEAGDIDVEDPAEQITLVCHSDDVNRMLETDPTLSNSDYMKVKLMAEGKLDELWGCKIKKVNHLFKSQTVYRRCAMYAKSAIRYGEPRIPEVYVSRNPMYRYRIELYCNLINGALRLFEKGVVEVQCTISPAVNKAKTA
jgi:hypothetical protein